MMKQFTTCLTLLALLVLLVSACTPEPPPPPEDEPPPEPTPAEYHQQLRGVFGAMLQPGVPAPPDPSIQDLLNQAQSRRLQLTATENGRGGLALITRDVDDAIRAARDEERWRKIKALCMLYGILQPGNERYAKVAEHAEIMLNRPQVTVTGFIELDGELYAFMDLFDPKTGETTNYRRREGEEFHGVMRLVSIIGNQQSVELEYLPARYIWSVPGPRERSRSSG